MTIAFDFDNTITLAYAFFGGMMKLALKMGHTVIICTLRGVHERKEVVDFLYVHSLTDAVPVVYCNREIPKAKVCARHGYAVDVWIDDSPEHCREILTLGKDAEL